MQEEIQNAEALPETAENGAEAPAVEPTALEQAHAELGRLEAERSSLQDQLLRRAAEFDNFRKRTERDRAALIEFASFDAVKALLPVLDDFERALSQPCSDPGYSSGIELIYKRMADTLAKLGLEPVEAEGRPFDPELHHAIEMVPSEEHTEQTVIADLLRGYTFKGRLMRPTMVRVAVPK